MLSIRMRAILLPCQTYFSNMVTEEVILVASGTYILFALYIQTVQMFSSNSLGITYFHMSQNTLVKINYLTLYVSCNL
jgi:hypothetical protein